MEGNRASIKYRFKHATGSLALFEGGGVQVFLEDNRASGAPGRTAFDLPEPEGVFDETASMCSDPTVRPDYDPIDSGNFTVHDAP